MLKRTSQYNKGQRLRQKFHWNDEGQEWGPRKGYRYPRKNSSVQVK